MEHKGTIVMETERMILRPFKMQDAEECFENWTSDAEMTKYTRWQVHPSVKFTEALLEVWTYEYDDTSFYQWAIELKDTHEIIGTISAFNNDDDVKSIELGYCIGHKWWHHGYMQEAANRLLKFFFEDVGMNRIAAVHDTMNPRSGNVMKKIGMTYEGTLRQADVNVRGTVDICVYSILASDYFDQKK